MVFLQRVTETRLLLLMNKQTMMKRIQGARGAWPTNRSPSDGSRAAPHFCLQEKLIWTIRVNRKLVEDIRTYAEKI
jgi:hypothetical protein